MSSKYDLVKVRVQLGEHTSAVYSRYVFARMLMMCRIPETAASRIALRLKKTLVLQEHLQVSLSQLFADVRESLELEGMSAFMPLLRSVHTFQMQCLPLIMIIAGTANTGKTSVALELSARLVNNNLLHTAALREIALATRRAVDELLGLCKTSGDTQMCAHCSSSTRSKRSNSNRNSSAPHPAKIQRDALWDAANAVESAWEQATMEVSEALRGHMRKALREGRTLIVEGAHISFPLVVGAFNDALQDSGCRGRFARMPCPLMLFEVPAFLESGPSSAHSEVSTSNSVMQTEAGGNDGIFVERAAAVGRFIHNSREEAVRRGLCSETSLPTTATTPESASSGAVDASDGVSTLPPPFMAPVYQLSHISSTYCEPRDPQEAPKLRQSRMLAEIHACILSYVQSCVQILDP